MLRKVSAKAWTSSGSTPSLREEVLEKRAVLSQCDLYTCTPKLVCNSRCLKHAPSPE